MCCILRRPSVSNQRMHGFLYTRAGKRNLQTTDLYIDLERNIHIYARSAHRNNRHRMCTLFFFRSENFVSTKWRISKGIFGSSGEELCMVRMYFLSSKVYKNTYDNQLCNLPESRFTAFAWIPNFSSSSFFPVGEIGCLFKR